MKRRLCSRASFACIHISEPFQVLFLLTHSTIFVFERHSKYVLTKESFIKLLAEMMGTEYEPEDMKNIVKFFDIIDDRQNGYIVCFSLGFIQEELNFFNLNQGT